MYHQHVTPHHILFVRFHQRLRENGTFNTLKHDCGCQGEVSRPILEEAVVNLLE